MGVDSTRFEEVVDRVDLVFDTVGGETLARSASVLRPSGKVVSITEPLPTGLPGVYYVVEPDREQLLELSRLVDQGAVRPAIDVVVPLIEAKRAFERVMEPGKRGKVVLRMVP